MINLSVTGILPSGNGGLITRFKVEIYKIPKADFDLVKAGSGAFTVGHNIDTDVDAFLASYNRVRTAIAKPAIQQSIDFGYSGSGGTYSQYLNTTASIRELIHSICDVDADYYSYVVFKGSTVQTASSSEIRTLNADSIITTNGVTFDDINADFYVNFDEITKIITSVGTAGTGKKAHISVSLSWNNTTVNVEYKDNGGQTHLYFNKNDSTFVGFFIESDDYATYNWGWSTSKYANWTYRRFWGGGNYNSPTQLLDPYPDESDVPNVLVQIVQDSSFYQEPEVYSKI